MNMSVVQFKLMEEAVTMTSIQAGEEDDEVRNIIKNSLFVICLGTYDVMYYTCLLPSREIQYSDISTYQDLTKILSPSPRGII